MTTTTQVDLVEFKTNTVGTGSVLSIGAATDGHRGSEALVDGATYSWTVAQIGDYEIGRGVYSHSAQTLTRRTLLSSNSNAPIAIRSGAVVAIVLLAEDLDERVGIPANFTIGTVTSGSPASVTIGGVSPNFTLNFVLKTGADSTVPGPPNVLVPGTVTKIAAGGNPTVSITGTSPSQALSLGLVTGDKGDPGDVSAAQLAVVATVANDAAMARIFAADSSYGVSATSTANQTTALQSAIDAASAYAIANGVPVEVVVPKSTVGGIRVLGLIHRLGVLVNLNWGTITGPANATYGDNRQIMRQDYNNNSWTDPTAAMAGWPWHFAMINGFIDGNAAGLSPWTWSIDHYTVTQGGSYTAFPTGISLAGTAGTGNTQTIVMGVNTDGAITSGGTGFTAGHVGTYLKLAAGTGGTVYNSTFIIGRIDAISGGAVTAFTIVGGGGYTVMPTGALAMTSHVDADNIAVAAGTGFTWTPGTWQVALLLPAASGTGFLFTDFLEGGGSIAATITGGTSTTTALVTITGTGSFYKNNDQNQGSTQHNAAYWCRTPQNKPYVPKFYFENVQVQNCQGDGFYWGSFCQVTTVNCSSLNCYRGGYTIVCAGIHRSVGFTARGWGQILDIELSGGYMASTTKLCVSSGYATINAPGTGYVLGDILTVPVIAGAITVRPMRLLIVAYDTVTPAYQVYALSSGEYIGLNGSTYTGVATAGGLGSGLTMNLQCGVDYGDFSFIGIDGDCERGCNLLFLPGDYRFSNGRISGSRHIFQSGGAQRVQWNNMLTVSTDAGVTFGSICPYNFVSINSRWVHRPRIAAVVPPARDYNNDRQTILSVANNSGSATIAGAIMQFNNDTFDGVAGYPFNNYVGIRGTAGFYPAPTGYRNYVILNNVSFVSDYFQNRVDYGRSGYIEINSGDLGMARGGGISSLGDHTVVTGGNYTGVCYGSACSIAALPKRGNANPFLSFGTPAGAGTDARMFNRVVGVIDDADNKWGAVNSGALVYAELAGLTVVGDNDPTSVTTPGMIGMRYRPRRPVTQADMRGWGCTVGSTTSATWIAA